MTLDELRPRYPGEAASIPRFLRIGEREVIRGLRYDDRDLEEFPKAAFDLLRTVLE